MYILYTQSIEIIFMSQRKNLNHVYPHIRSPSDPAHRALMRRSGRRTRRRGRLLRLVWRARRGWGGVFRWRVLR